MCVRRTYWSGLDSCRKVIAVKQRIARDICLSVYTSSLPGPGRDLLGTLLCSASQWFREPLRSHFNAYNEILGAETALLHRTPPLGSLSWKCYVLFFAAFCNVV